LEKVLRAARLIPVSFSFGLPAMQSADSEPKKGILALAAGETAWGCK